MKRVFIGILVSESIQHKAVEFQLANQNLPVRFIQPHNLHITLVPPWQCIGREIKNIQNKLQEIDFPSFSVSFNQIGFGPNAKEPRLIWAKGEAIKEIYDLKYKIHDLLEQKPPEKNFKLHITLARIINNNPPLSPLVTRGETTINWQMEVNSFVLYESRLLPEGAEYELIETFKLRV